MLTIEQIIDYLDKTIAENLLSGNTMGLKQVQTTAGVLMAAAHANGDTDTMQRFRVVAAHAANKLEVLNQDND